jgi:hypothetical protein
VKEKYRNNPPQPIEIQGAIPLVKEGRCNEKKISLFIRFI